MVELEVHYFRIKIRVYNSSIGLLMVAPASDYQYLVFHDIIFLPSYLFSWKN